MYKKRFKPVRNIILSLLLVTFLAVIQGCTDLVRVGNKFLAKPPSAGVTQDSVFSDPELARRFLWHIYSLQPYYPYEQSYFNRSMLASLTDISYDFVTVSPAFKLYYGGTYSSKYPQTGLGSVGGNNNTRYNYDRPWKAIRAANIFIENIDEVPGMSEQEKNRLKAEAQMIIANFYIDYFRNFGGVPWVNHSYSPNENFQLPRLTAMATVDSIVSLLNEAIPHLPFALDDAETESGRYTAAAAMGLKVRLLLFAASPLFNSNEPYMQGLAAAKKLVWYGGYHSELWERAADAAKEFIQANKQHGMPYHLVDTGHPRKDFRHAYYDRSSSEVLISVRNGFNSQPDVIGAVTDNYVKMFPMADGTPISKSPKYDPAHPYKIVIRVYMQQYL